MMLWEERRPVYKEQLSALSLPDFNTGIMTPLFEADEKVLRLYGKAKTL